MAIHGNPPALIKLSEIMAEFGDPGNRPVQLSQFYRGGGRVPDIPQNNAISTAGAISLGMFYGASNFPPAGQLLSAFCSGFNKYGRYTNGSGGTYDAIMQHNSPDCGYAAINGRTVLNAALSLDFILYVQIHFVTGEIEMRFAYFDNIWSGQWFNYSTGAGVGHYSGNIVVGNDPETGNPIYGPGFTPASDILYDYVKGSGAILYPTYDSLPGFYGSASDNRDYISRDGIGQSFAIPNIGLYDNVHMNVNLPPTFNTNYGPVVQPSAANGWVGSFALAEPAKGASIGIINVTIDAY